MYVPATPTFPIVAQPLTKMLTIRQNNMIIMILVFIFAFVCLTHDNLFDFVVFV